MFKIWPVVATWPAIPWSAGIRNSFCTTYTQTQNFAIVFFFTCLLYCCYFSLFSTHLLFVSPEGHNLPFSEVFLFFVPFLQIFLIRKDRRCHCTEKGHRDIFVIYSCIIKANWPVAPLGPFDFSHPKFKSARGPLLHVTSIISIPGFPVKSLLDLTSISCPTSSEHKRWIKASVKTFCHHLSLLSKYNW